MRLSRRNGSTILIAVCLGILFLSSYPWVSSSARQGIDQTVVPTSPVTSTYITVTYIEPINVRSGPSSFDYPVIGTLPVGATAPATGRSPAGEWIQISFPTSPNGYGWVYAANVTLSGNAILPEAIPPATPAPERTATVNPTFEAALRPQPTNTRKPTFTAPPPLQIPTYANTKSEGSSGIDVGWFIVGFAVLGIFGVAISSLHRR